MWVERKEEMESRMLARAQAKDDSMQGCPSREAPLETECRRRSCYTGSIIR